MLLIVGLSAAWASLAAAQDAGVDSTDQVFPDPDAAVDTTVGAPPADAPPVEPPPAELVPADAAGSSDEASTMTSEPASGTTRDATPAPEASTDPDRPDDSEQPLVSEARSQTYVSRWFFRGLLGGGSQPDSGTGLLAATVELGAHPFLGAFGTFFSAASETGGARLSTINIGIGIQLDIVYLIASRVWTHPEGVEPHNDSGWSFNIGIRLSLSTGFTQRATRIPEIAQSFILIRPEWRFFADVEWRVARDLSLLFRPTLDTSIDVSDLSRWGISVGLSHNWGGPAPGSQTENRT
ncbi:MAG: hypothetical protein U0271_48715 [Polyangiaceae bacterium]